jgi:hypothetical protein
MGSRRSSGSPGSRGSRTRQTLILTLFLLSATPSAHDLERTQVSLTFARDGSFVLDVKNDPNWLKLRLESIKGPFADRVVLWVDGREVRPVSVEVLTGADLVTQRLRGRMPLDARTLRWYYGLVGDPYPLTVRRADGRIIVEEIGGDAWSGTIDLSGQFAAPARWPWIIVAMLFAAASALRFRPRLKQALHRETLHHGGHEGKEDQTYKI